MKKLCLLALTLLLSTTFVNADYKIAVVDLQKILQNVPALKGADAGFKQEFTTKQAQLATQSQQLTTAKTNFAKDSAKMTPEQKIAAENALQKQNDNLQTAQSQYASDFQTAQAKLMQSIFTKIKNAISQVSTAEGYDIVLPQSSAIYFKPSVNITQKVIAELNAKS